MEFSLFPKSRHNTCAYNVYVLCTDGDKKRNYPTVGDISGQILKFIFDNPLN